MTTSQLHHLRHLEVARATAISALASALVSFATVGAPRWDRTQSDQAHHAWECREMVQGLLVYVAQLGTNSSYTLTEGTEVLEEAVRKCAVTTQEAKHVWDFFDVYEAR